MAVPLRRCGLRCCAWHRAHAWWYDDSRIGMLCHDLGVDVVAVVRAIAGEGRHRLLHQLEQGAGLRAVVRILVGQHRRDNPARVSVRGEMQLTPATPPLAAMLLDQPLAGSTKL